MLRRRWIAERTAHILGGDDGTFATIEEEAAMRHEAR
jgi:hypothetical protein